MMLFNLLDYQLELRN